MNNITWYGHAAFLIEFDQTRILIDPFLSGNPQAAADWRALPAPDAVLVTHFHDDHKGDALAVCRETGAHLGAMVEIAQAFADLGLPRSQILNHIGFNIGGSVQVKNIRVTMTEAFHSSAGVGLPAGFILTLPDGRSIYHAGDTGVFCNMATWGVLFDIAYALLPVGGVFTMDCRQAALAASMLKAQHLIPMHWGTFPALAQSLEPLRSELAAAAPDCVLLEPEKGVPIRI